MDHGGHSGHGEPLRSVRLYPQAAKALGNSLGRPGAARGRSLHDPGSWRRPPNAERRPSVSSVSFYEKGWFVKGPTWWASALRADRCSVPNHSSIRTRVSAVGARCKLGSGRHLVLPTPRRPRGPGHGPQSPGTRGTEHRSGPVVANHDGLGIRADLQGRGKRCAPDGSVWRVRRRAASLGNWDRRRSR